VLCASGSLPERTLPGALYGAAASDAHCARAQETRKNEEIARRAEEMQRTVVLLNDPRADAAYRVRAAAAAAARALRAGPCVCSLVSLMRGRAGEQASQLELEVESCRRQLREAAVRRRFMASWGAFGCG
jgi:hypothetical protein